jgi:hypothetical protein
VYPEPSALIGIYDNTVPKEYDFPDPQIHPVWDLLIINSVLEILAQMVSQDKTLNVGSFGGDKAGSGSESGHGVE